MKINKIEMNCKKNLAITFAKFYEFIQKYAEIQNPSTIVISKKSMKELQSLDRAIDDFVEDDINNIPMANVMLDYHVGIDKNMQPTEDPNYAWITLRVPYFKRTELPALCEIELSKSNNIVTGTMKIDHFVDGNVYDITIEGNDFIDDLPVDYIIRSLRYLYDRKDNSLFDKCEE